MIATLLTSVCLSLSPAMVVEPPTRGNPVVAVSGDAIPMIVNGEPQFAPTVGKACTYLASGCPAGTVLLQSGGEPLGCDDNCDGSCYSCTGAMTPLELCQTATALCLTGPANLPVACGQKIRHPLGCYTIVAQERGIPNLSPSCACDTEGGGIPEGDCQVRPCSLQRRPFAWSTL